LHPALFMQTAAKSGLVVVVREVKFVEIIGIDAHDVIAVAFVPRQSRELAGVGEHDPAWPVRVNDTTAGDRRTAEGRRGHAAYLRAHTEPRRGAVSRLSRYGARWSMGLCPHTFGIRWHRVLGRSIRSVCNSRDAGHPHLGNLSQYIWDALPWGSLRAASISCRPDPPGEMRRWVMKFCPRRGYIAIHKRPSVSQGGIEARRKQEGATQRWW
jgi:hypothetical protein